MFSTGLRQPARDIPPSATEAPITLRKVRRVIGVSSSSGSLGGNSRRIFSRYSASPWYASRLRQYCGAAGGASAGDGLREPSVSIRLPLPANAGRGPGGGVLPDELLIGG